MQINYKHFILSILLSLLITVGWAQTPQLHFILDTNESGATKNYVARDYIALKHNFRYKASPNQSFRARIDKTIDITLSDGTVIKPDGTTIKPDGTTIKPNGTITKPDGTVIKPDGTIFKTNGTIINTDGTVAPNVSQIIPEVWYKTVPVTSDINGRYKWKDFSPNNVALVKYSTNGATTEYSVGRDSIMNYNFNPAIDLSAGNVSKEIMLVKSNLAQATIIGVWGSKKETTTADNFVFAINGRQSESVLFSKSNVYSSVESGKEPMIYGNDTVKNLLCQSTNTSARKARETSLRIASYYKSNVPNTTLWGEPQKAAISLGSSFQNTNVNNTSTFSAGLNNLAGFKGYTPELLVFRRVLSPIECSIFESYLAIKYGVSMDKSYLSGTGRVIWNYNSNAIYNNRITGYGREDLIGLNQKMATTSYQEAPYYSDSCDSYLANNANSLSSSKRLLVMGCQPETPLCDGEYVLFGDDNNPITDGNTSIPGYTTMQRKWLVNINTNRAIKNRIELSYFDSLATRFANHSSDTYLMIDRTGKGEFNSSSEVHLTDSLDAARSKIIFKNIDWSTNTNGCVAFTFAYKVPIPPAHVKKSTNTSDPVQPDPTSSLNIYYTTPHEMSSITVRLQTAKPTVTMITVYDISGRLVFKQKLPESHDVQYANIKLSLPGVYIVNVLNNETSHAQKVISSK